ncbi:uncharacterized protein LOC141879850 isoform X2 [Acropora palmata]|uniref:uncharacterized protein LOC141879850 isoform X2 n=1 Tax=Acropora palmata TaxID=6131 RepID=UPI003DA13BEF
MFLNICICCACVLSVLRRSLAFSGAYGADQLSVICHVWPWIRQSSPPLCNRDSWAGISGSMIKKQRVDVNEKAPSGNTALHGAVNTGNISMVQTLINAGTKVNACNAECATPHHLAIMGGNSEMVSAMLEAGCDKNAKLRTLRSVNCIKTKAMGLYRSWKTWKVMEFKYFSFQAWKVMENNRMCESKDKIRYRQFLSENTQKQG